MSNIADQHLVNLLDLVVTNYVMDPENADLNYEVAAAYEKLGQWAAALSFYLRTAERTNSKELAYECLIKVGLMFDYSKNRNNSVRGMFKAAILVLPERPEAYFLLARHYEREKLDYVSSYVWACLGEKYIHNDQPPLRGWVEYPGKYGMKFEKAVAGWYWGQEKESMIWFQELLDEYGDAIDQSHKESILNNLKLVEKIKK